MSEESYDMIKVGYALASEERLRIVTALGTAASVYSDGLTALTISRATGINERVIPYHLALLVDSGLVRENAKGEIPAYKLSDSGKQFLAQRLLIKEEYFENIRRRVGKLGKKESQKNETPLQGQNSFKGGRIISLN